MVINETMAKKFWPDEDALGERFHFFGQDDIMPQITRQGLWPARMAASLLGGLGLLALLLASIGIYGVMSYAVSQRNREIGIRMALGARRGEVLHLFMKQGLNLVAIGAAIGLVLAGFMSRAIASLLYDLSPIDFQTFAPTTLVLAIVALLANFIPARRATSVAPVVVLRYE